MDLRKSYKTVEFWLGIVSVAIMAIFPDFPKESFFLLGTWVAGRIAQKTIGDANADGQRSWQTSEFWISIGFAVAQFVFPGIDPAMINMAAVWILGRPIMKGVQSFKEGK